MVMQIISSLAVCIALVSLAALVIHDIKLGGPARSRRAGDEGQAALKEFSRLQAAAASSLEKAAAHLAAK